ncbi:hypothetical protein J6590_068266 [Homalodisca vitripennis]|nr:hypothetical protein J6590_068266 [Homalodisca vitripennis]
MNAGSSEGNADPTLDKEPLAKIKSSTPDPARCRTNSYSVSNKNKSKPTGPSSVPLTPRLTEPSLKSVLRRPSPSLPDPVANESSSNNKSCVSTDSVESGSCKSHKILLASDSHGKNLGLKLHLWGVVHDVHKSAQNLTFNVTDVINAGSNDITRSLNFIAPRVFNKLPNNIKELSNIDTFLKRLREFLLTLEHIDFLIQIQQFDRPDMNEVVHESNRDLYENSVIEDCEIVALNAYQRKLFTVHGQNLNQNGKNRLCKDIYNSAKHAISNINLNLKKDKPFWNRAPEPKEKVSIKVLQSTRNKLLELEIACKVAEIDIVCVSEHWLLNDEIELFTPKGYLPASFFLYEG